MKKLTTTLRALDVRLYELAGRPFDKRRAAGIRRNHRLIGLLTLALLLLASCTTTKQAVATSADKHALCQHDERTRHSEPTPSRIK